MTAKDRVVDGPRGVTVDQLPPAAQPASAPRRRPSVSATIWLTLVWILLWGDLTWANLLGGVVVAFVVSWVFPMPRIPFAGRVSALGSLRLLGRLAWDILVASIDVARMALSFGRIPHGGVIRVPLRSHNDLYLTLTADLCSLVPGSIVVEAHRATSTLYLHVFDLPDEAALAAARAAVYEQETIVLYALGSPEEIAEAGLPPRRWWGGPTGGVSRASDEAGQVRS